MINSRTKELFLKSNSHLRVKCQSHLFRSLLEFVKSGIGVSLIDPFTLAHDDGKGYVVRPFRPNIYLDLALIKHKTRPISKLGESFYNKVYDEMSELSEVAVGNRASS